MKIEFKRAESKMGKRVSLYVGGDCLRAMEESDLAYIDWKNASEAQHACKAELEAWIDEDKPQQVTAETAYSYYLNDARQLEYVLPSIIEMVEKRTREIVEWEQDQG